MAGETGNLNRAGPAGQALEADRFHPAAAFRFRVRFSGPGTTGVLSYLESLSNRGDAVMKFEKQDAWKSCHALAVAVLSDTRDGNADDTLLSRLRWCAMRSAAKIAFGTGTGNRRMFRNAVSMSAGYLGEFAYYLTLAEIAQTVPQDTRQRWDALRGRASFYTWRLLDELTAPGGGR